MNVEAVSTGNVALIGPYPPPYGGVSVHLKRLFQRLKVAGYAPRFYCQPLAAEHRVEGLIPTRGRFTYKWWLLEHGWRRQAALIHCHDGWHWSPALWWLVLRGKRVVMTFHDQQTRAKFEASSAVCRLCARQLLRSPRVEWIAVSSVVRDQLLELGASAERIQVIPAFLAPVRTRSQGDLPAMLEQFMATHQPRLVTYGWRLSFDEAGHDLYGFDLCIELIRALKPEFPDIGLVCLLPQVGDEDYLAELRHRVSAFDLTGSVQFWTEPLEEPEVLWSRAEVFVRATTTDGDAVSVREALSLGVPVVASDASPRPQGTVLFPTRDLTALTRLTRESICHHERHIQRLAVVDFTDSFSRLLDVYQGGGRK